MRFSQKAVSHTNEMEQRFSNEIERCIKTTKVYTEEFSYKVADTGKLVQQISVVPEDSVSAIMDNSGDRIAVLNFASFKRPGGGFLTGRMAQEESLCHSSFLFNVLERFSLFYAQNGVKLNNGMYANRALYAPNVIFEKNNIQALCDVITCAAPNRARSNVLVEENHRRLESRIRFVLEIAADNKVDTLILGAYGCGVFMQDPEEVSIIFRELLKNNNWPFTKVIFAIPKGRSNNYEVFKHVLCSTTGY